MTELAPAALAVEQTIRIAAPRQRVFALLTEPTQIGRWMPVTRFELRLGGLFEFTPQGSVAVGKLIDFEPPRLVAYTWDWGRSVADSSAVMQSQTAKIEGIFEKVSRQLLDEHPGDEQGRMRMRPGWTKVAAFGDDREALLLYDLTFLSGAAMRIADHYTVSNGKIQTETILWDTHGFR
jgi:uncharacterized protein YndB with AHSA1/START domain